MAFDGTQLAMIDEARAQAEEQRLRVDQEMAAAVALGEPQITAAYAAIEAELRAGTDLNDPAMLQAGQSLVEQRATQRPGAGVVGLASSSRARGHCRRAPIVAQSDRGAGKPTSPMP